MINRINENLLLDKLTGNFCRSEKQVNSLHESDSEIIIFENNSDNYLAVTIDSISEEIKIGLYSDPYLIGWMSVMVNMSDLAAVGAEPIGILISEIFPHNLSEKFIQEIQRGISDAVNRCNTFVLGGDTNSGDNLIITGCAVGKSSKKYLTRIGCSTGEIVYTSGTAGKGNAFALSKLFGEGNIKQCYFPEARLSEGLIIKEFATSCIDSSDGLIAALDQLSRLNHCGFELESDCVRFIEPGSLKIASTFNLPSWLLLAGEHGDFELIFTIPISKEKEFLSSADKIGWHPLRLGRVIDESIIKLLIDNTTRIPDCEKIRNLAYNSKGDVNQYLKELLSYNNELIQNQIAQPPRII
jgi:thiamine-monophosphate kinase